MRVGLYAIKEYEVEDYISCLFGTGWETYVESNDKAKADFSGN
jgi:hypothetical protein